MTRGQIGPASPSESTTAETQLREGAALLAQGKLEGAIDRLTAALALEPDFAAASFVLAQALWMQGKLEPAAERLRDGLRLMPQVAEAHNNLGLLYNALRKYDAAVESFRTALAVKPDLAWAHCNLSATRCMRNACSTRRSRVVSRALAIDPGHAESCINLGNVPKEQGDLKRLWPRIEGAFTAPR